MGGGIHYTFRPLANFKAEKLLYFHHFLQHRTHVALSTSSNLISSTSLLSTLKHSEYSCISIIQIRVEWAFNWLWATYWLLILGLHPRLEVDLLSGVSYALLGLIPSFAKPGTLLSIVFKSFAKSFTQVALGKSSAAVKSLLAVGLLLLFAARTHRRGGIN